MNLVQVGTQIINMARVELVVAVARARDKLFDAAMWAALLILEEDAANPQEDTWTR